MIFIKKSFLLLALSLIFIPLALLGFRKTYAQQQGARIYLEPNQLVLDIAGNPSGTMAFKLDNVPNKVAAFEAKIFFDPDIIHAQNVTISSSILNAVDGSSTATQAGPLINNDTGYIMFGAYNISFENIIPTTQRPVTLATINWQAVGNGTTSLSSPKGHPYLINTEYKSGGSFLLPLVPFDGGSIQVNSPTTPTSTPTPTPQPTNTPIPTQTSTSTPTNIPTNTITPTLTPTITLTPTPTSPLPTPTPSCLQEKYQGDYDCKNGVTKDDFDAWFADYKEEKTTLSYYEYWRRAFYR